MSKNTGPFGHYEPGSTGYVLNALYHFGVPLRIVESVTVGNNRVLLGDKQVCTWCYVGFDNQLLFDFSSGAYFEYATLRDHDGRFQLTYSGVKMCLTFCVPADNRFHQMKQSFDKSYSTRGNGVATFCFLLNELHYANKWVDNFNAYYRDLELFEQGVTKHGRRLAGYDDWPSYPVNSVVARNGYSLRYLWAYLEDYIFPEITDGEVFVTYKGCTCAFKRGVEFAEFASLFPKSDADTEEPVATSSEPIVGYTLVDMDLDDVLPH